MSIALNLIFNSFGFLINMVNLLKCDFFRFSFYRHHTKSGLIETVNKCDAEKKPEINHKPFNNCVAQLRENIVNSPVS